MVLEKTLESPLDCKDRKIALEPFPTLETPRTGVGHDHAESPEPEWEPWFGTLTFWTLLPRSNSLYAVCDILLAHHPLLSMDYARTHPVSQSMGSPLLVAMGQCTLSCFSQDV